jgi:hypothetical protein
VTSIATHTAEEIDRAVNILPQVAREVAGLT